jgi:hypothetical protein
MNELATRIESSTTEHHHARARHSRALHRVAEVQDAVCQLTREINDMQSNINASYLGAFMCYRTIVAAAKASEASFCDLLSPLIRHSEALMSACDDTIRQLQVPMSNSRINTINPLSYLQVIAEEQSPWQAAAEGAAGVTQVVMMMDDDRRQQQQQQVLDKGSDVSLCSVRSQTAAAAACKVIMQRVWSRCCSHRVPTLMPSSNTLQV